MAANKLQFETSLDGTGFSRGLSTIGQAATHNLKGLVVGAFGIASIQQAIAKTVQSASELVDTSQRLDLTIEQLQVLRQAAKDSGVEFNKLTAAFERINIAREKALGGDAKKIAAFARLGVTREDLQSRSAADLFTGPMAAKIRNFNAQDVNLPGAEIFGARGFGQLIPVLKNDFAELQEKMQSLGSIISTEAAVQVDVLADEFSLLSNIIVAQIAPALAQLGPALLAFWGHLQTTGAYIATLFTNNDLTFKDWFLAIGAGLRDLAGSEVNDEARASQEKVGRQMITADEAKAETAAEQEKLQQAFQERIAGMVARIRQPPAPEIAGALSPAKKIKPTRLDPSMDALVSVGNFLGSGPSLIQSIAEQQLQTARAQLVEEMRSNTLLDKISGTLTSNLETGGIEVP